MHSFCIFIYSLFRRSLSLHPLLTKISFIKQTLNLDKERDTGMSDFPPGYRFFPTEEELLGFYLQNKLENQKEDDMARVMPVVDVYSFDPWQLPDFARVPSTHEGEQWFYFCPQQEREAQGGRPSRTTPSGYWKATGSPSVVYSSTNRLLGMKKSMVFYHGKAPTGTKSKWKLNEYRAYKEDGLQLRSEFSLCRLYANSSGLRQYDRRPRINATSVENQNGSNKKTTIDPRASSSKKKQSNDSSSSDGGDCQHPLDHIETTEDSKVQDEEDWNFWDLF
ncbi:NAC domain-containing protein 90 [Rhynchospora pubera]|uniref:NAC domain-containing protein 90 n=1 Tax=Rhynchospora pubera TaxID=906938 RepID=A0AAV8CUY8_9POAL|nr:NAC domain-containing protein 90 [Rhynchospora pubera]